MAILFNLLFEKKTNFYLEKDFLDYLIEKKYTYEYISKEKLKEIESNFMKKLDSQL